MSANERQQPMLFRGGAASTSRWFAIAMLISCSQPHSRGAPPPRPKDVPPVLADAAPRDAAFVDATSPSDARQNKVMWQRLRDRDRTSANVKVAAVVLEARYDGSASSVVLDRGGDDGVAAGWKGSLVDHDDHRVGDEFEITDVEKRVSRGRIKANPDQTADAEKHVVLWNPSQTEP